MSNLSSSDSGASDCNITLHSPYKSKAWFRSVSLQLAWLAPTTQCEDRNRALAFDVQIAKRRPLERGRNLLENLFGCGDRSWRTHADQPCCDVDRVAPNVELVAFLTHDPSDDW